MTRLTVRLLTFVLLSLGGAVLLAMRSAFAYAEGTAFIMAGSGFGTPPADYVTDAYNLFIQPNFPDNAPQALETLEQYWPWTGLDSMTFAESVAHDAGVVDAAIKAANGAGNHVVVLGYSQSASVATLVMQQLAGLPADQRPTPEQLAFVLLANTDNPNGGLSVRFSDLSPTEPGAASSAITPVDALYPTDVYTLQYDPVADFPQYPLNVVSVLNSLLGYLYLHSSYADVSAEQVAAAVQLPTSPGYHEDGGLTDYHLILTQDLPLLNPLRGLPLIGSPLADLLQPVLRVLVDLGYGDGYANVPTPMGLFPDVNLVTVGKDLLTGVQQGVVAALVDIGVLPSSELPDVYPYLPMVDAPAEFANTAAGLPGLEDAFSALGLLG